jgi:FMN-dependent NADH-azoreductase
MSNLLVINSSLSGEASVSELLVEAVVSQLVRQEPGARVVRRELAGGDVPHLTSETVAGVRGQPTTTAEQGARGLSDRLIAELRAADTIVIGAPMYNFSIPSTLKAWFDHVLRAGETFSYSEAGPKGLLTGRRVVVVEARGGLYSEGPAQALDFQEPYLRQLLGFIGLTDVTFIRAEKIGYGPDARDQAIAAARAEIARLGDAPAVRAAA